jgi:hypothetical protein
MGGFGRGGVLAAAAAAAAAAYATCITYTFAHAFCMPVGCCCMILPAWLRTATGVSLFSCGSVAALQDEGIA